MRSSYALRASSLATATVSSWVTPTRISSPSPIAPTTSPSTVTLARLTVWTSALTPRSPPSRHDLQEAAFHEVRDEWLCHLGQRLLVYIVGGGEDRQLVGQGDAAVAGADQCQYQWICLLGPAEAVRRLQQLPVHRPALGAEGGVLAQPQSGHGAVAPGQRVARTQAVLAVEPGRHLRAQRLVHGLAQVLDPDRGIGVPAAPQRDQAEADRLDLVRVEPVEPRGGLGRVLGGVGEPETDVGDGVGDLTLDDPRVQAGTGDPAGHPLRPVLAGDVQPVGEVLDGAALGEQAGCGGGQLGADGVAGAAGVTVGVRGGTGTDDERRGGGGEGGPPGPCPGGGGARGGFPV